MIDTEQILQQTFVRHVVWHDELDSTNTLALDLASRVTEHPLLVGTSQQTQGRGRGKNSWWAGPGALTFSLVFAPNEFGIETARWPVMSLVVGLSVCRALEPLLSEKQLQLKWPNDVFARGRKICGILIESVPNSPRLLVAGIGVNANNSLNLAPDPLGSTATSLLDLRGGSVNLTELLQSILQHLEQELQALGSNDASQPERWRSRCALTGRIVTLADAATQTTGYCQGIEDDGALCLQTERGPQRFYSGVITDFSPLT